MTAVTTPPDAGPGSVQAQLDRIAARLDDLSAAVAAERARQERWSDLVQEVNRITGSGVASVSSLLADAEQRGWFIAARAGGAAADRMAGVLARDWPQQPPSALGLLRLLRDPGTRLGLARLLRLLHALGADGVTTPGDGTPATDGTPTTKD